MSYTPRTYFKRFLYSSIILTQASFAFALNSANTQKYELFKEMVNAANTQAIPANILNNADFNTQLSALDNNPAEQDLFLNKKITSIAVALNTGYVKSDFISDKIKIKPKKFDFTKQVDQYLNFKISTDQLIQTIAPKNPFYYQSLNVYYKLVALKISKQWATTPKVTKFPKLQLKNVDAVAVPYLRERLNNLGYNNTPIGNINEFDADLDKAVKDFQQGNNITADGVIGDTSWKFLNRSLDALITQAMLNVDRARWLPNTIQSEFLYVNLAGNYISYIKDNATEFSFKTINGRTDRQTPIMLDRLSTVVLNPTWTVPKSIFIKDKIPMIMKDPKAFEKMHMTMTDSSGQVVDPKTVDWSKINENNLPFTLVQRPGLDNALGVIKFPLTNAYAIYLHDTNARELFKKTPRFFSSGCVRLEDPFKLAELVLDNPTEFNVETLKDKTERNTDENKTPTYIKAKKSLAVYLMYFTTTLIDGSKLNFLNDAYEIDQEMYKKFVDPNYIYTPKQEDGSKGV